MADKRRTIWLAGVLGLAIVAAIVVRSMDSPTTVRRGAPTRPAAARAVADETQEPADVKLEALKVERVEPTDTPRNPFRFAPKAPPPPPPRPGGAATPGSFTPSVAVPAVPSGPPPPPPGPMVTWVDCGIGRQQVELRPAVGRFFFRDLADDVEDVDPRLTE